MPTWMSKPAFNVPTTRIWPYPGEPNQHALCTPTWAAGRRRHRPPVTTVSLTLAAIISPRPPPLPGTKPHLTSQPPACVTLTAPGSKPIDHRHPRQNQASSPTPANIHPFLCQQTPPPAARSMKVLCSACEAAEARVLCCADEAALCACCDRDVHAANRLAGKHRRLPLHPPDAVSAPTCDICQESQAYFFCVEDRALLCRSCDVAVHTANDLVSAHRRFLLTGVQVGLQPDAQYPEPPPHPPNAAASASPPPAPLPPPAKKARTSPAPIYSDDDDIDWATAGGQDVGITGNLPDWPLVDEQFSAPVPRTAAEAMVTRNPSKRSPRRPLAAAFTIQGGLAGGMPDWPLEDFFAFSEFNAGLGFTENGTSKADSGKLGSTDGSPTGRSSTDSAEDFFGQVPEFHQWSVPELPSPPTASGLHWQGGPRHGAADDDTAAVFVPDISSPENPFRCFAAGGRC